MAGSRLDHYLNIADLHRCARGRLPFPVYQYLERGADDEFSLVNNISAFDHYQLQPRALADVDRALQMLRSELERDMTLAGCASIADIGPDLIRHPQARNFPSSLQQEHIHDYGI